MFDPASYTIIAHLFPRFLGFIYFFAFGAFLFQMRGLLGESGILPISSYLSRIKLYYPHKYFWVMPTLFWCNSSNRALMGLTSAGTFLSLLLMFGIAPPLMLFLLYVLYLSIVSAGQDFLGFGWEGYVLEMTAHAFFLSLSALPNPMVWVSLNLLLFRFHFQAGVVKLQSRDPNWRNLRALMFHYQTQPLPNTLAWYAHKLPLWFQKLSCAIMFFVELVLPFGIFLTDEIRLGVCLGFLGLQFMIWISGNYSFLNHLTALFSTILISNTYLEGIFNTPSIPTPLALDILLYAAGSILFALQVIQLYQQWVPNSLFRGILQRLAPFHLANRYGIFGVMTTNRIEIVVEGSNDAIEWKEYLFKYKPSELNRRPRRISPYQPRLDWQAWFLPFTDFQSEGWFQSFLYHLLKGTPDVLTLVRENPFPAKPPTYVRSLMYLYEFTTFEEKKATGRWWKRSLVGNYSPIQHLKLPRTL